LLYCIISFILFLCSGVHCPSEETGVAPLSPPASPPVSSRRGGLPPATAWAGSSPRCFMRHRRRHLSGCLSRRASLAALLRSTDPLYSDRQVSWQDLSASFFPCNAWFVLNVGSDDLLFFSPVLLHPLFRV
jgi:hypothetical protein